jgi:hypothetical protein
VLALYAVQFGKGPPLIEKGPLDSGDSRGNHFPWGRLPGASSFGLSPRSSVGVFCAFWRQGKYFQKAWVEQMTHYVVGKSIKIPEWAGWIGAGLFGLLCIVAWDVFRIDDQLSGLLNIPSGQYILQYGPSGMRELREKVARHYGRQVVQLSLSLPKPKEEAAN